VQLFNRYATYNGSNPYKAPALMNMISHLEFNTGAFLPQNGMHQITEHLVTLAEELGVTMKYNEQVDEIIVKENKAVALKSNDQEHHSDLIASDLDIHTVYQHLLPQKYLPKKLLRQEKSSSAYVFYWGINKEFDVLGLHNILFSEDYKKEFDCLFNHDRPSEDPTIYINITSKYCKQDAPAHCENWFVMVNVPHNKKPTIDYAETLRKNIVTKINRVLKTDIEKYIVSESKLDPIDIAQQTSSYGGSLYGNSSNNKFAAFLRHANYSSKIKGLYFVGGSVHPGGGIPLCLWSAKIASQLITEKEA
jgi:phytoene desaturase